MPNRLVLRKKHSNGRMSEVLRQPDGRYTAQDGLRHGFASWSGFTANIATIQDAKVIAARHSHADGCDTGCGPWLEVARDDRRDADIDSAGEQPMTNERRYTLSLEADAWIRDGMQHGTGEPIHYRVRGLPPRHRASVARIDGRWQILRRTDVDWTGRYDSPEQALAALQAEIDRANVFPNPERVAEELVDKNAPLGMMATCEQCGGKNEWTGKERARDIEGLGPRKVVREAELRCTKCGKRDWSEIGAD